MKKELLSFLIVLILLAGCKYVGNNKATPDEYFSGSEGIDLKFDRNTPPKEIYLREGDLQRQDKPDVPIEVRVTNEGASLSKGGVYLSGYDPTVLDFEGLRRIENFQNCNFKVNDLSFRSTGSGGFNGFVQCQEINLGDVEFGLGTEGGISWGEDGLNLEDLDITVDDLNLGESLDNMFQTNFFTGFIGFNRADLNFDTTGDGSLAVNFESANFNPQASARGPYFLSLWAPIRFDMNNGRQFLLEGDVPESPGAKDEFVTFDGEVKDFPEGREKTTQPLLVTSCYLYTTHAGPRVCIDPSPRSNTEKSCRPTPYTNRGGQGSPVAITRIDQRNTGDDMIFEIEVENIGDGTVYNPLTIQKCSPYNPMPLEQRDKGVVMLGMAYVGNTSLECNPKDRIVNLYNGRGKIECVYDMEENAVASQSGYETSLVVELWYGYSETIRKDVTIRRLE